MDPTPSFLCLFASEDARQASCFSGGDHTWVDRTDHGRCRYLSINIDADEPDSGHMRALAAVVVVQPAALQGTAGERLRLWLAALEDHRVPVDLLATDAPVTFYTWLNQHAPRLLRNFQQDGAVTPELPSWWRQRAEFHLANPGSHGTAEDDHSTGAFSVDVVRRYLANRNRHGEIAAPGDS
jgi:hypothetical protein